jgi:hypothetical protein
MQLYGHPSFCLLIHTYCFCAYYCKLESVTFSSLSVVVGQMKRDRHLIDWDRLSYPIDVFTTLSGWQNVCTGISRPEIIIFAVVVFVAVVSLAMFVPLSAIIKNAKEMIRKCTYIWGTNICLVTLALQPGQICFSVVISWEWCDFLSLSLSTIIWIVHPYPPMNESNGSRLDQHIIIIISRLFYNNNNLLIDWIADNATISVIVVANAYTIELFMLDASNCSNYPHISITIIVHFIRLELPTTCVSSAIDLSTYSFFCIK